MSDPVQGQSTASTAAAGRYPDPGGAGGQSWWDGQAWSTAVQAPASNISINNVGVQMTGNDKASVGTENAYPIGF